MGSVVDFGRTCPHNRAPMKCMSCGHEWEEVAPSPDPMVYRDCPECGCGAGMKQGTVEITGALRWTCSCGSSAFEIYRDEGVFCINCGSPHHW